jgi:hypothetical protein
MATMVMVRPQKNKNEIQSFGKKKQTLEGFSMSPISSKNATTQLTLVSFERKFQALQVLFYGYFCQDYT